MKKLKVFLLCSYFVVSITPAISQYGSLGFFKGSSDIVAFEGKGKTKYDSTYQQYYLFAPTGNTIEKDERSHFVWTQIKGDFIIYARATPANTKSNSSRFGLMVRTNLDANASFISANLNGRGRPSLQLKNNKFIPADANFTFTGADVIQLEKIDSNYTIRVAKFGEPFVTKQVTSLNLGDELYVGLFISSTTNEEGQSAVFKDVRITIPVDESLSLVRTNIGSNLEVLDVATGNRKLICTDSVSMYSPIWMKDGETILYSKEGQLYTYSTKKYKNELLNTGGAKLYNNDHVLSADGDTLAVCIKIKELGGTILHTLPAKGGIPRRINDKGSTYPHCWSPEGKTILFTTSREGEFDVYKISSGGGKEIRLTDAKGRDDCPEFTPDGRYIYFNSNRNGEMLLYRMLPDGTKQEAITDGKDFYDWFPHISPDGKWILFLSYAKDEVSSAGNPYYKQVYLRLMPFTGGTPKIIAYLYGGNGTINSPCWSADSKKIVFASNTDIKQ